MGYVKNTWVDQEGQVRYTETEDDGYKIFTANYDEVTELGTPVNATNMNHIEDGLALSDVMKYSSTVTYSLDEWVTGTVGGTKGIYKSLANNNTGNALTDTTKWGKVSLGSSLKLGQSVWSPDPLIDSDLHLYNGSQYATDGIYADFVTRYLTPLKTDYPARFKTEAEWQTINTQYGACGFWVLDTENNVFRFPNIVGITENTTTEADLGKLTEAGLPNITSGNWLGVFANYDSTEVSGSAIRRGSGYVANGKTASGEYRSDYNLDASRSSSIYGNSNTVQPQTISGYLYCVVATDQTPTEAETDINEIATDLALKADVDLTNVNNAGTSKGAGWSMPSETYENLVLGASGTTYTAPANGWVQLTQNITNGVSYISIVYPNSDGLCAKCTNWSSNAHVMDVCLPVSKGEIFKVGYSGASTPTSADRFQFIYAKGSESEA